MTTITTHFEDAFEALNTGRSGRAVLPISNSTYGPVTETVQGLEQYGAKELDRLTLKIGHALLRAKPSPSQAEAPIERIYSHEQVWPQSWLLHVLPDSLPLSGLFRVLGNASNIFSSTILPLAYRKWHRLRWPLRWLREIPLVWQCVRWLVPSYMTCK